MSNCHIGSDMWMILALQYPRTGFMTCFDTWMGLRRASTSQWRLKAKDVFHSWMFWSCENQMDPLAQVFKGKPPTLTSILTLAHTTHSLTKKGCQHPPKQSKITLFFDTTVDEIKRISHALQLNGYPKIILRDSIEILLNSQDAVMRLVEEAVAIRKTWFCLNRDNGPYSAYQVWQPFLNYLVTSFNHLFLFCHLQLIFNSFP